MKKLQKEIIAYEHVLPEIDPEKEIRRSVDFLKDYLKAHPFLKSLVLGISGVLRFNFDRQVLSNCN